MRTGLMIVGGLAVTLFLSASTAKAQQIEIGFSHTLEAPLTLGHTMRVSFSDPRAVLESSAPEVVRLSQVFGRPAGELQLEARSPGRATLRARLNGEVLDEVAVEVQTPDEVWWSIGTYPEARGRGELAIVEGEYIVLSAACVAQGRVLLGFPPDLLWSAGGAGSSADGYEFPTFEQAGGAVPLGDHASTFTSAAWTLPGPRLEIVSVEDVTVSFVTHRLPQRQAVVRLVLTRADGSVVEGGRISTPTGFGLPIASLSPPGYFFRRDRNGSATFTFLLGDVEHSVEVEGYASILNEGPIGNEGGCAVANGTSTEDSGLPWFTLVLVTLATLCGRGAVPPRAASRRCGNE